jgi:hypothetical protein
MIPVVAAELAMTVVWRGTRQKMLKIVFTSAASL